MEINLSIDPDLVRKILTEFIRSEITRGQFLACGRQPFRRDQFGRFLWAGSRSTRPTECPGNAIAIQDLFVRFA